MNIKCSEAILEKLKNLSIKNKILVSGGSYSQFFEILLKSWGFKLGNGIFEKLSSGMCPTSYLFACGGDFHPDQITGHHYSLEPGSLYDYLDKTIDFMDKDHPGFKCSLVYDENKNSFHIHLSPFDFDNNKYESAVVKGWLY